MRDSGSSRKSSLSRKLWHYGSGRGKGRILLNWGKSVKIQLSGWKGVDLSRVAAQLFLRMKFCDGGSNREMLRKVKVVGNLCYQIGCGLLRNNTNSILLRGNSDRTVLQAEIEGEIKANCFVAGQGA